MLHRSRSSEWLIAVLIAVLLAMVIRLYFYAPYRVYGSSMFPTLQGDELLIVNKWIYGQRFPSYGDIIVFHTEEDRDFIKRVIGLPGDEIAIRDGYVWRNGKKLKEPYISSEIRGRLPDHAGAARPPVRPGGQPQLQPGQPGDRDGPRR